MAGVKIGLDFGTHFTKICIEDSTDKRNKSYLFHRFYNNNGELTFMLPSVAQLNKDNTLSYGFVDSNDALEVKGLPEKNPPQTPLEPEYRSYKQFPEIVPPDRQQFVRRTVNIEGNQELAFGYLMCMRIKCAEYFKKQFNIQPWPGAKPAFVKAVIYNLKLSEVKAATSEDGEVDFKALCDLAVSRSNTDGRVLYQQVSHPNVFGKRNKKSNYQPNPWLNELKLDLAKQYQEAEKRLANGDGNKLYEKALSEYQMECIRRKVLIEKDKKEVDSYNENLRIEHEHKMKLWLEYEKRKNELIPATFRSFKQMVFSEGYDWRFEIDPMLVAIWYLCYVFFDLDKEYGTQYLTVCMGTSSGQKNWDNNKIKATQIILTVYDLIENVFNHDRERFLSATLDELKRVTNIKPFSQSEKENNAIYVFPEAFANLNPLAKQKKFSVGMNSVVDIGGGTTDISFFVASKNDEVKIFDYVSIPYGVNAIEKNGMSVHYNAVETLIDDITKKIKSHAHALGVDPEEANDIVSRRPIVFTGGGSMIKELRRPYIGFSDIMHLDSSLLSHFSLDDSSEIAEKIPLLSTSLGLALCGSGEDEIDDSKITIITYKTLFETVEEKYRNIKSKNEDKFEFGFSDY